MDFPKVPTGPVTIGLNGMLIDSALKKFAENYLPAYTIEITSGYRTPAENEAADGATNSAHLYNLARDFVLIDKSGKYLPAVKLRQIYNEFVKPYWKGYSYYNNPLKTGVTGWIHVNVDRNLTNQTKIAEYAIGGIAIGLTIKKLLSQFQKKDGKR